MRTATIRQPASMKSPIGPPGEEAKLPQDLSRHFRVYEENVRKVYRLCKRSARSLPPSGPRDATHIRRSSFFGVPGIEPGLHAPEACVLPVYYTPTKDTTRAILAGNGGCVRWSRIFSRRRSKIPRPRLAVAQACATSLRLAQRDYICRRAYVH